MGAIRNSVFQILGLEVHVSRNSVHDLHDAIVLGWTVCSLYSYDMSIQNRDLIAKCHDELEGAPEKRNAKGFFILRHHSISDSETPTAKDVRDMKICGSFLFLRVFVTPCPNDVPGDRRCQRAVAHFQIASEYCDGRTRRARLYPHSYCRPHTVVAMSVDERLRQKRCSYFIARASCLIGFLKSQFGP